MLFSFKKTSLGIDITDSRILVTRLKKIGANIIVDSFSRVDLEPGVVTNSRIVDKLKLAESIKSVFTKLKSDSGHEKRIIFSLPKDKVFIHVFTSDKDFSSKGSIEKIIKEDVEKSIPLEADDIYYSYKILSNTPTLKKFLIVAVSKSLLKEWQDFFTSVGIDVQVYDLGSQATYRNLFKKMPKNPICMIDIGSDVTSITIFNSDGLRYSHAIRVAGRFFTELISKDLKLSFEEAEKIKIKEGIRDKSKIFDSLVEGFDPIINTTKEIIDFVSKRTGDKVEKVIIVGGSSLIKGLPEYLSTALQLPVELGKPIIYRNKSDFEFLNSIGLALRGLEKRSKQLDPGLSPLPVEKKNINKKISSKNINTPLSPEEKPSKAMIDYEKIAMDKKLKRQKIVLVIILLMGVLLILGSYWYRNKQKLLTQERTQQQELPFSKQEVVSLQIPVAITPQDYTVDKAKGRITESLENNLSVDEKIWPDPVRTDPNRWLIYSESDIKSLAITKIKQTKGSNFSLDSINYLKVEPDFNNQIYIFNIEVNIYLL